MIKKTSVIIVIAMLLMACGNSSDIASVNGKNISADQFDAYIKFKRLSAGTEETKEKILNQYLEREALAGVIEKEGVLDLPMTQAELNEFRKEMLISRYFEKYLDSRTSDQAIRNYYNTHASNFEKKKVHVAHILVRTHNKMTEVERKAKLTTAQEAYSKIMADEEFAEIAKKYSEDKVSSKKGGDLGWIGEGGISKKFSEVAFNLKQGEVSEPFVTEFGFHILKVLDEPKIIKQPFEAVAGNIRYQLRNEAKRVETQRLMEKAKIKKM